MEQKPITGGDAVSILLVDDTPTNLQVLFKTLSVLNHKLLIAKNGTTALTIAKQARPSLILLDVMMPDMDGYEVCRRLKADPDTRDATVIFLSALDDTAAKVKGLEAGAVDFITKPFQAEEVIARVRTQTTIHQLRAALVEKSRHLERELKIAQEFLKEANQRLEGPLLGEGAAVKGLRESISELAAKTDPVLLTGKSGSGEEAVARAIHAQSNRASSAFIYVNCALAQSSLSTLRLLRLDAETDQPPGPTKFDLAEGGTIYLDLIHEMPFDLQMALLRRLDSAAADKAAGRKPESDVRVIAFTSQDLARETSELRFDARLTAHLAKNKLRIPSLYERKGDIPVLANFFAQQQARRLGKAVEKISEKSLAMLAEYAWPGSVRELQNVMEREVAVTQKPVLDIDESLFEGGVSVGGYRLTELLGKGGMGEVWRAKHELLARPAAVKLVSHASSFGVVNDDAIRQRFQREAQVTAYLVSPHTVTLYDFGVTKEGALYYVMELLNGMDLRAMVEKFGPLPPARVIFLLRQFCYSLAEAHDAGLVHRDIKPDNLFACRLGSLFDFAKILDFGIVKGGGGGNDSKLTMAQGGVIGTPAYMSPEAIRGEQRIDARADLYSLGCAAFWMLTGAEVFESESAMGAMVMHVTTPPRKPSEATKASIPRELDALILKLLEKEAAKRPASAKELIAALDSIPLDEAWTQNHAENWWQEHLPQKASSPAISSSAIKTITSPSGIYSALEGGMPV